MFKNANSRILFWIIELENLIEENISLDGKKVIFVPVVDDFPTCFRGDLASPSLNSTKYFLLFRLISNSSFLDNAFTTDTPTPCKPPETL